VYTAHGFHFGVGAMKARHAPVALAEWLAGRVTDRLVVINETDLRNARRLRLVAPDRVVHHRGIGVDLDWYDRDVVVVDDVRDKLGVGECPMFTIVASLHPGKGHLDALGALAAMRSDDAHLVFAGDGLLEQQLRARVAELGLDGRVHFLGQVSDVRALVVASTATVLPSSREGLSRATLESLCLGTPVIGYDIRGIADTVRPDGGVLVPVGDVNALAGAMQSVIDAPPFDDDVRRSIRQRLQPYSISSILDQHERLYEALLLSDRSAIAA
jgi:glycosyltransferase involved in cell wall biosynthesis